jgi:hypothetical protein
MANQANAGTTLAASSGVTSTGDWDTVSAMRYADLDRIIKFDKKYPTNFEATQVSGLLQTTETITGTFDAWTLNDSASGENVGVSTPVLKGSLTVTPNGGKPVVIDITGATAIFSLKLAFFDCTITDPTDSTKTSPGKSLRPGDQVTCMDVQFKTPPSDPSVVGICKDLFNAWAVKNIQSFGQEFALVDLSGGAAASNVNLAWLKPTAHHYLADPATPDPTITDPAKQLEHFLENSIFSVMTMTENRVQPKTLDISNTVIPDGCTVGFLISYERYMEKMLMPHVHNMFVGATEKDFDLTQKGRAVKNNKELVVQKLTLENGDVVEPKIAANKFILALQNTYLELSFLEFFFEYGALDYTVHLDYTSSSTLTLDASGNPKIDVVDSSGNTTVTANKIVEDVLIGLDVLAVIAALMGGALAIVKIGTKGPQIAASSATAALDTVEVSTPLISDTTELTADAAVASTELTEVATGATKATKVAGWFWRNSTKITAFSVIGGVSSGGSNAANIILKKMYTADFKGDILNPLMKDASSPVAWPRLKAVDVTAMQLNGALQFGGKAKFDV